MPAVSGKRSVVWLYRRFYGLFPGSVKIVLGMLEVCSGRLGLLAWFFSYARRGIPQTTVGMVMNPSG